MDPFSKKRMIDIIKETNFKNNDLLIELGGEFGRRVAKAEKDGLPLDMAFEACKEHFKLVGQAMIQIGNSITLDNTGLKSEKKHE